MPADKWPATPYPQEAVSIKTCPYDKTNEFLAALQGRKGSPGRGWKIHHKKKGTPTVLVKMPDGEG